MLKIQNFEQNNSSDVPQNLRPEWQHSKEYMCHLQNIAKHDYQESVTTQ